jgi:hypothetical protein
MTARPELRPATAADVAMFYPGGGHSMRAIVAELDGRVIGLAGLVFRGGQVTVVSALRPEMLAYRKTIMRGARIVAGWARQANAPALADPDYPNSAKLLARLGFTDMGDTAQGRIFGWPG